MARTVRNVPVEEGRTVTRRLAHLHDVPAVR